MLKQFFILCSGADRDLLKDCSEGEQTKYVGIGATVFFTAVMAFLASAYALFTVFDSIYPALIFGFVWSLLIFNLDRFIVSTIKKRDRFMDEFIQATPRIILAIIIAIVISKPLEIKIFEKEINTVLLKEKNEMELANKKQVGNYFKSDLDKNKAEIASLKNDILTKEKEVNALYATYITEAEGTTGTKKLGKGPVYKEKREKHDASLKEFETLKADVQEIIDLIAAKNDREANNKLLEVSEKLDEMIDFAEEDEEVREITRYQVLLNQLHVKINGEEPVDGE